MDELIIRVLSSDAGPLEERRLARWRALSAENEQHYQDVARIWNASPAPALPEDRDLAPPPPELIAARGQALRDRERRAGLARTHAGRGRWALAAAAVVAAVSIGVWVGDETADPPGGEWTEFAAGNSEGTTVALSDGSFVRLDAGATLQFRMGGGQREASLSGRAFFGVASDPARPFIVETALGDTRVLGTRFEVDAGSTNLRVLVVEGRVAVSASQGRATELGRGQIARVAEGGDFSVTSVDDVYEHLDWPGGLLLFQGTPLPQVAEEIAAHFSVPVSLGAEVEGRTLTAWFDDEALEEVVESICLILQAACEVGPGSVRIGA